MVSWIEKYNPLLAFLTVLRLYDLPIKVTANYFNLLPLDNYRIESHMLFRKRDPEKMNTTPTLNERILDFHVNYPGDKLKINVICS